MLRQCVTDKEVETSDGDWENAVTQTKDVLCSSWWGVGSWGKQGTAVKASAFVQLTIITKSAPCVKLIMCKWNCSTDPVLHINSWTGFCKSPTASFISAGIMMASPDCLSVQSAIISAPLFLEWLLCCEAQRLCFLSGCRWERIPWPFALGILVISTRGTTSNYWSDCICAVCKQRVYHGTVSQDK